MVDILIKEDEAMLVLSPITLAVIIYVLATFFSQPKIPPSTDNEYEVE